MTPPGVRVARRYYLLKWFAARDLGDVGLASTWKGKHDAELGTALAADFPSKAKLEAAGYTALEDIRGAEAAELIKEAGLSRREAEAAVAAAG